MFVLRVIVALCYFLAAFLGLPLLLVGTWMLFEHVLGDTFWGGVALAPVALAEFFAGLCFFMWDGDPIRRWIVDD